MKISEDRLILDRIRASLDASEEEICDMARQKMKHAGFPAARLHFRLYKKSVDARGRGKNDGEGVFFVCSVLAVADEKGLIASFPESKLQKIDARFCPAGELSLSRGTEPLRHPPLVVGMGPAGLFAALLLAEEGFHPIIIDRGDSVADRVSSVGRFWESGLLDTDSNIQFGAGGAGTFSDGKLLTRIKDARCDYVLEALHRFGAPDEILTRAKPHIGTDLLRGVVQKILDRIAELGGRVIYRCRMTDLNETPDGVRVLTTKGEFLTDALILAIGNSARDTYAQLISKNWMIEPKPISAGVRIEHLQKDIDEALYGKFAGHPNLGHGEYALSDTKGPRGVYTFCMCPGGTVVAAASEEEGVVVNGMSCFARDGANANSAVAVSVPISDFEPVGGSVALGAIAYQRRIEHAAFVAGGSSYDVPAQSLGSFLEDTKPVLSEWVFSTYRNGGHAVPARLRDVFPQAIGDGLAYAFRSFGRQLRGFDVPTALLSAAETRTSAPVRILRGEGLTAIGHDRIYPCGEGAGYAGGITSAAVDGMRCAEAVISRFYTLL